MDAATPPSLSELPRCILDLDTYSEEHPSSSVDISLPSSSAATSPKEVQEAPEVREPSSSTAMATTFVRKRRKKLAAKPSVCLVCGDESTGHHYDVPSCNSCKIFFRRAILKQAEFHCQREMKCEKLASKRHFLLCRYCRFKKCVDVGMNPMGIVTEEELTSNKLVRRILGKEDDTEKAPAPVGDEVAIHLMPGRPPVVCTESRVTAMIDQLRHLEERHQAVRRSEYCPRSDSDLDLESLLKTPCSLGMNYKEMEGWPLTNDPSNYDVHLPLDLHLKYRIFVSLPTHYLQCANIKEWIYVDPIYAVDYARAFGVLNKLDHVDQLRLLRHVAVKVSNITSGYFSYQNKSMISYYPDGRTPYVKHETGTKNPWLMPARLKDIRVDHQMYLFMKAIVLCDPVVEGLSDHARRLLTAEREKYANALMRYVLASYGAQQAPEMFIDCLKFVEVLESQMAKMRAVDNLLLALDLLRRTRLGDELGNIR